MGTRAPRGPAHNVPNQNNFDLAVSAHSALRLRVLADHQRKESTMKRIVTHHRKAMLVFAALLCAAASARAESPHFVGKVTATLTPEDNAQVCWKEAGLDDNILINTTASAD